MWLDFIQLYTNEIYIKYKIVLTHNHKLTIHSYKRLLLYFVKSYKFIILISIFEMVKSRLMLPLQVKIPFG